MPKESKGSKKLVLLLVGAFFLVLFLNTYFNYTSGIALNEEGKTLSEKFYLAGPDPYYNARLIEKTIETGKYPYLGGLHGGADPLLNYPLGRSGGRPPLFNMITAGVGMFLSPLMGKMNALGYAMQFLPALYGALLVIPVYVIGSIAFNKKAGIIGAFIVSLIPIHLSSGHGSAFSLYDHDSFILLLTTTTIMFLLLSLKEKHTQKSLLYAMMAGVSVAGISLTWVAGHYIYTVIGVYGIVQMIMDILTSRINSKIPRTLFVTLFTGYLLAFPMYWIKSGFSLTVPLAIVVIVAAFSLVYIWLGKKNIPWVLSLPTIFSLGGIGITFLYLIRDTTSGFLKPFVKISDVIFGSGIYGKKVSLTIAEASTFDFSRNVMSFGPVIYLLAWGGFLFLLYHYYKKKYRRDYFLLIIWFLIEAYLITTAGRFLNNLVPLVAILSGWMIWQVVEKIDFSSMIKTVKSIGGGWYGIKKGVKTRHIAGAVFIVLFIMMPNAWMAFDASLPATMKDKFKSDKLGAFGLGLHTEKYWTDAFSWLKEQNSHLNDTEKPAFISWWDYGFYCVAMADNPTVADNFQDGIPPAANFHTAKSEKEAVAIFIIRLAEGDMKNNNGKLSEGIKKVFEKYLGNKSTNLTKILEEPATYAPSYNTLVSPDYQKEKYKLPSPSLWPVKVREENAMYHDATEILMNLSDEEITWFYHDMQNETGYSIRYYGVEGYDINIFNVFTFLADKGIFMYATREDDYFKLNEWYEDKYGGKHTPEEVENMTQREIQDLELKPRREIKHKDAFYDTMVYKTYLGETVSPQIFENYSNSQQLAYFMSPTTGMKHFVAEYVSPITQDKPLYFIRGSLCRGCPAVVIAKYYEGARISGTIQSEGEAIKYAHVEVQKNITMFGISRGISHDSTTTDENGYFTLIAPAGNISLIISQGYGTDRVVIKRITFNGTGVFAPITDDDAMRRSPTWKRDLGIIEIERGSVEGMVYWDKDGDGLYNESKDSVLPNAVVKIGEKEVRTNSKGKYEVHDLIPGSYELTVEKKGYDMKIPKDISIKEGETEIRNIPMTPSRVMVSGIVWYDEDGNGLRGTNESMADVDIQFTLISAPDENAGNATASSNSTGFYQVRLYPGKYKIEVNYTEGVGNESVQYTYTGQIEIKIGDEQKTKDIKLKVAKD